MCDRDECLSQREERNLGKCRKYMDTLSPSSLTQYNVGEFSPKRKVPNENAHSEVLIDKNSNSNLERLSPSSVDEAVRCCLSAYTELPSSGKPGPNEWTVLSGVVELRKHRWCVLALATGSWSAPAAALDPSGAHLHDAHAEVLARRAMLRYTYHRLLSSRAPPDNLLLYTSRAPCGAAAQALCGETGAWCLNGNLGLALTVRSGTYKELNPEDPTAIGALLHAAGVTIGLRHIVVGGGGEWPELVGALRLGSVGTHCYTTLVNFDAAESELRTRVAPTALVWALKDKTPEVIVRGKKLGLTKKTAFSPKTAASVSKYRLYQYFLGLLKINPELRLKLIRDEPLDTIPYNVMKHKSVEYQKEWAELKETVFKEWTLKPDIWSFCVEPLEHFE